MNTGFEAKGTLLNKGEIVFVTDTFTKRNVWIKIDEDTEYPQTIEIELVKDKCDLVDKFNVGDSIAIDINVRGRQVTMKDSTERVFNSLNGWRVRGNATGQAPTQPAAAPNNTAPDGGPPDDLPF